MWLTPIQQKVVVMIDANLLNTVTSCAKFAGEAAIESVDSIVACVTAAANSLHVDAVKVWLDKEVIASIERAYKLGDLAYRGYGDNAATELLTNTPKEKTHKDSVDPVKAREWLDYRANISAWNQIKVKAGAPKPDGTARAPRATAAAKAAAAKAASADAAVVMFGENTRATTVADTHAFALRISGIINAYLNDNSRLCTGEVGGLFRDFVMDTPQAIEADKPRNTDAAISLSGNDPS
jgi:hypothetical protein